MPTKRVTTRRAALALACALGGGAAPAHAAAHRPPPTLVLFTHDAGDRDDFDSLKSLRSKLRDAGHFDVLTYDIESPAVLRAADDARHPEWLTTPAATDADRLALSKALGASFYAVITHAKSSNKPNIQFTDVLSPAHTWIVTDKKTDAAADILAADADEAIAQRAAATPPSPTPPPAAPTTPIITITPAPPVVLITPPVVARTPSIVPITPAAPVTITPPIVSPPPVVAITPPPVIAITPAPPVVTITPPPIVAIKPATPPVVKTVPVPPIVVKTVPAPAPAVKPAPIAAAPPAVKINTAPPAAVLDPQAQAAQARAADEAMQQQLAAVRPLLAKGDAALARGEIAMAISLYRQAVDGAPRAAQPRLALAQAYVQGGFRDKALDEAKRALQVSPDSAPIKEFLVGLDTEDASSEGSVALYSALVEKDPEDVSAHIGLASAYWNEGSLDRAESEYKSAQTLEAASGGHQAVTQLVRMYGAQSRYADALEMLAQLGATRYPLALSIIKSRADALLTELSTSRDAFEAQKSSHEQFYDTTKKVADDAQALADFVGKVTPPSAFKLSHLHRQLAVNLIAQEAAVLMTYIETSDADQGDKAASLEKSAQSEMLTANAGEQKNGMSAEGN